MVTRWTRTVPTVAGYYWVAGENENKICNPDIIYCDEQFLFNLKNNIDGLLIFGDKRIPEPLSEKY